MSKFFVTTPIYYVNDKPHLGHAYTTLCADVLARWRRQKGSQVFFLTGTDEHGAKVQESADQAGLGPLEFAGQNAQKFKDAWTELDISYDYFIRTSDPEHEAVVKNLLQRIYERGYIYQGEYEGLYCVGCEKFLQESDISGGRCFYHPTTAPIQQKETNYFFKLSEFGDKLRQALAKGEYDIVPPARKNEVMGKIKSGLDDVSISRSGVSWGIKVPWDEAQTVYVWVDALINYYSATQFAPAGKNFWPADVHLMAKDILWFHAVIWPALLIAAGLDLPKIVAVHGFFTIDGQKMSKSLGNVINPGDLVQEFGVDAARYLLLTQIPFNNDGDISLARFRERYQSDLANGWGNTLSRVTNMIESYLAGKVTDNKVELTVKEFDAALRNFRFDAALAIVMSWIKQIDEEIEHNKPWQLAKAGRQEDLSKLLSRWHSTLVQTGELLAPFMPQTSQKVLSYLKADKIIKAAPLFPRIDQ